MSAESAVSYPPAPEAGLSDLEEGSSEDSVEENWGLRLPRIKPNTWTRRFSSKAPQSHGSSPPEDRRAAEEPARWLVRRAHQKRLAQTRKEVEGGKKEVVALMGESWNSLSRELGVFARLAA